MFRASIVFIICLGLITTNCTGSKPASAQSITISDGSVGFIIDADTNQAIGTGFVAVSSKQVITADHVAKAKKNLIYRGVGQTVEKNHILKLKSSLPEFDLAVFSTVEEVCKVPLPLGDIRRIRVGDRIFYLGFKVEARSIEANIATVIMVNTSTSNTTTVEFLDFVGVGKPGFSGGPVFDTNGSVIAVMRAASTKRTPVGEQLINRAFSTRSLLTQ